MGERTFHVVGTEEFGYSTINRYWFSFYQYMNIVKRLCELYQYASVKYLKGYVLLVVMLIMVALNVIMMIIIHPIIKD